MSVSWGSFVSHGLGKIFSIFYPSSLLAFPSYFSYSSHAYDLYLFAGEVLKVQKLHLIPFNLNLQVC